MWNNNRNLQPMWRGQPVQSGQTMAMTDKSSLIQKVMWFTSFSILAAAAGVWIGSQGLHSAYNFGRGTSLLWMLLAIGLSIGALFLKDRPGINFVLLYGFTFVTGVAIAPLMQMLVIGGYSGIILQALLITGALTFGLSFYAWTTKRDFSGFAPYLFVGLIGLLLVSLLNIFLASSFLASVIMYGGVLLFSFYMIYDVQQAKYYQNTVGNAIAISIGIYTNILNIFLFIIQILMSFQND